MLARRPFVVGAVASIGTAILGPRQAGAFEWRKVPPAEAGLAPDIESRLDKIIAEKRAWGLHAVVVASRGKIVLERYFDGPDEAWGRPLGRVAFGPDTLHDLRSVTKSVLGLLYGIALAQGKVPPSDRPLLESFPEHADIATDPRFERLTIAHALTMTLGLEWNENIPYQDPNNSEIVMEKAADRYRYIFSRPFMAEPGTRWTYGAAATALIGRLIVKGTGLSLPDFARAHLFDPVGIGPTVWTKGFNGEPSPSSGLRMTPRDLARIGQLVLNRGEWDGRQVVSADWLERSFKSYVAVDETRRYGYFWYLGDLPRGSDRPLAQWVGAYGYGGQLLYVVPGLELVVAVTAGNYTDANHRTPPIGVIREVVLASVP